MINKNFIHCGVSHPFRDMSLMYLALLKEKRIRNMNLGAKYRLFRLLVKVL